MSKIWSVVEVVKSLRMCKIWIIDQVWIVPGLYECSSRRGLSSDDFAPERFRLRGTYYVSPLLFGLQVLSCPTCSVLVNHHVRREVWHYCFRDLSLFCNSRLLWRSVHNTIRRCDLAEVTSYVDGLHVITSIDDLEDTPRREWCFGRGNSEMGLWRSQAGSRSTGSSATRFQWSSTIQTVLPVTDTPCSTLGLSLSVFRVLQHLTALSNNTLALTSWFASYYWRPFDAVHHRGWSPCERTMTSSVTSECSSKQSTIRQRCLFLRASHDLCRIRCHYSLTKRLTFTWRSIKADALSNLLLLINLLNLFWIILSLPWNTDVNQLLWAFFFLNFSSNNLLIYFWRFSSFASPLFTFFNHTVFCHCFSWNIYIFSLVSLLNLNFWVFLTVEFL